MPLVQESWLESWLCINLLENGRQVVSYLQVRTSAPCRSSREAPEHASLCGEVCWQRMRNLRLAVSCHHPGNTLQETVDLVSWSQRLLSSHKTV